MMSAPMLLVFLSAVVTSQAAQVRGIVGAEREQALLQTYEQQLSGSSVGSKGVTPITRVENLLKDMSKTLNKEQEEDEALYDKLACWCNNNKYEKNGAANADTAKISDLEATIEMLTARSAELNTKIKELEAEVSADKASLATASKLREKQLKEFHAMELDNVAALENLKAAIVVLSRHNGAAFPQVLLSEGASPSGFLQDVPDGWSAGEINSVKGAIKSATTFLQAHTGQQYMPSYSAKSGEIFGVLKQLQEEMQGALSEEQKTEALRAASFAELRQAKTSQIESGEKMAETKEDELAQTDMDHAEAKEDLGQTRASLSDAQMLLANLETTCKDADANFAERKKSRLEEIEAVSQTIEILNADDAKDAMDTTFSFMQIASNENEEQSSAEKQRSHQAAAVLRKSANRLHNPDLAMLATTVELDAFTKVKAMIDNMISTLQAQQADEVKKNDWCGAEIQANEMDTMKAKDLKADQEAKIGQLEATIKTVAEEIEKAHLDISSLNLALQRASENRKQENLDFQKVVADQMVTAEILGKALDKLAKFYDDAALAQTSSKRQTPPVAQKEYSKSSGATGVMSMIEKVIHDTKEITAESKKSEGEAQAAYESLVADTNASIADLAKEITSKTQSKAKAKKTLAMTQGDLADTNTELEDLGKYNADMHGECDYLMKNFDVRQNARSQEVEALKQAKQILNGADLA